MKDGYLPAIRTDLKPVVIYSTQIGRGIQILTGIIIIYDDPAFFSLAPIATLPASFTDSFPFKLSVMEIFFNFS
jgi:hypothetical protein